MIGFICLIIGVVVGIGIMALVQVNKNAEIREKLENVTRLKDYYKDKCKEMQEELKRYKK